VLATLGRIIWVPIAFVLAALACSFVIFTLGLERLTHYAEGFNDPYMTWQGGVELAAGAVLLAQAFTLLPAIFLVLVGEIARIQSVYYYVVCGGLAAVSAPLTVRLSASGLTEVPAVAVWQVFATGGFIGGFIYWMLAGRKT